VETDRHLFRTIDVIRSKGVGTGVTLNPSTPLVTLEPIIREVDLILIMTVNPGFGGQTYIDAMDDKIKEARRMIDETEKDIALEVDGGIKATNAKKVVMCGADILVMGTEFFHSSDYRKKINEVRRIIED